MGFFEIVFYIGAAMMAGSVLLGLLAGVLLKSKGRKLRRTLNSEYGPHTMRQKVLRGTGERSHRVGTK